MTEPDYRQEYLDAVEPAVAQAAASPSPDDTETLLGVIADEQAERAARLDALRRLQALAFAIDDFRPHLPAYVETLRATATSKDAPVRRASLEALAQRQDEYAQRLLVDGLEGNGRAFVPARTAVRLLAYDPHGAPRELLRRLGAESEDTVVRQHALRQLCADGSSVDLFRKVATDPAENPGLRKIGLTALQSLDSEAFRAAARALVVDDDAEDDLRAASLTALTNDVHAMRAGAAEDDLQNAVRDARDRTRSKRLTTAATNYLDAAAQRSR